jgi:putative transposase
LKADIQRVWHANWQVYGADKVWLQMNREGIRWRVAPSSG